MTHEIKGEAADAAKAVQAAIFSAGSDQEIEKSISFAIKMFSSIHDKIMISKSRGTNHAKRFKRTQRNNTSGIKGVTFNKSASKWQAKIGFGSGKSKHLGYFETMDEAIVARAKAESEIWGQRR